MTREGEQELREELEQLVAQRGPMAERIKLAREFGDLAENAEYYSSRQEQEKGEDRIAEMENNLQHVEFMKETKD